MASAVFDTVSLILTTKIGLLETIASELEITITEEVKNEATAKDSYDAKIIEKEIEKGKINVEKVENRNVKSVKEDFKLDSGEASTIILQRRNNADIIVTDDKKAIKTCRAMDLDYTTTLNLLSRTREKEKISEEKALAKLEKLEKYGWYDPKIIHKTRSRIKQSE